MSSGLLLYSFAPLVIYFLVEYFKGYRAGIYAAIITGILVVGGDYYLTGEFDKFTVGETSLIVILGVVSLKMGTARYFKFQPTALGIIFSLVFAYFQFFDKPLLVRYLPRVEQLIHATDGSVRYEDIHASPAKEPSEFESQMLERLHSPEMQDQMTKISMACIWIFLAHAGVMAYAALRLSTGAWFSWRLAIYPALLITMVYYQINP